MMNRAPNSWPFEPTVNRFQQNVEDYYYAKFQIIPIMGFRFIVLTYTPTPTRIHTHISWQGDRYIRAAELRRRRE